MGTGEGACGDTELQYQHSYTTITIPIAIFHEVLSVNEVRFECFTYVVSSNRHNPEGGAVILILTEKETDMK